jgi:L-fuculose-phosphate aldolase
MTERELREELCAVGRRLSERGLVTSYDGNLSARLPDGTVLCTPSMRCKALLRPADLCTVDPDGRQLCGPRPRTSEILMHLTIYRHRPDVRAVVHAHPPNATAFAITGEPIPTGVSAEVEVYLGVVPTVPYETPGTQKFAELVVPHLDRTNTLLLANHGSVSFAETPERALAYTEILEAYCRVLLLARQIGPVRRLSDAHVRELLALKKRLGFADPRVE